MQTELTFPDVIRIESSGSCNFQCIHCPNGYSQTRSRTIPVNIKNINSLLWTRSITGFEGDWGSGSR